MSLRFLIGRSGSGKTEQSLNEIRERLLQQPDGNPIIYLVPDQMTFQSEYALVNTDGLGGMIRTQVFSFQRLAWRVLQETGGIARYHLNSTGVHMLLRKIIEHYKNDLKVFRKTSDMNGFIDQMENMVKEFRRYCISPDQLTEMRRGIIEKHERNSSEEILADKLHDFHLIYDRFENELVKQYVDSEDYLRLLEEKIPESTYLKDAEIYIDGFHSLTPQELQVIQKLMVNCRRVTVALTVDKGYDEFPPHELNLFSMTAHTYQTIKQLAEEGNVEIERNETLEKQIRFSHPSLSHIEKHYYSRPTVPYEEDADRIHLVAAVNRRAEVEGTARHILKLVREDGYRWRDIAILIRNGNDYNDLLKTVFNDYNIPMFLDEKRSMLNHPVIELIRSSLDAIQTNWRYDAIFRCIKTDLLFSSDSNVKEMREEMDQLENYVLSYGVKGKRWTTEWTYRRFQSLEGITLPQTDKEKETENMLNRLRKVVADPLTSFQEKMRSAKTAEKRCESIYLFLHELEVEKKIESLRDEAEKRGDLETAREHDQVWKQVIDLLDQMVEILGNENVSLELFSKMINTGLESMQASLVPPAIDQVLVGDIEHARFSNVKSTCILGVNDGVLPARPAEDGVLTEEEREKLSDSGVVLAAGSRRQLLDENFIIYLALSSASDHLWVSYPLADEEGKALVPSVLIKRIKDLYPALVEQLLLNEPNEEDEQNQLQYIVNPHKTLSYVTSQLQTWKKAYPIAEFWWDAYNWYITNDVWDLKAKRVLGSLFYRNEAKTLTKTTTNKLYGNEIQASVSRMEKFSGCPYSQFVSHGLRLKERNAFRLEAPDIGQLFHAALKLMSDHLLEKGMDWGELTKKQCENLSTKMVEELAPKMQGEILLSSNRYHYIKRKLQQVVGRASSILSEHAKASGFSPVGIELPFGPNAKLPAIQFTLPNGTKMELVGRIDRVDRAKTDEGVFLRIIDYKSSVKDLNLSEVYFGLSLQMLAYLDVVISYSKEWLGEQASPAGVLYFHVHNPMLNKSKAISFEQIEKELFKQFKMKGLLLANPTVAREMDYTLSSGHSEVIPAALKKDGSFYSSSSVAGHDQFDSLRTYVRKVMKQIGTDITDGVIDIAPYKMKDRTPCTFCSYRSVCQFDQSLEENDYRLLKQEKDDTVFEKMREKMSEDKGDEANDNKDS